MQEFIRELKRVEWLIDRLGPSIAHHHNAARLESIQYLPYQPSSVTIQPNALAPYGDFIVDPQDWPVESTENDKVHEPSDNVIQTDTATPDDANKEHPEAAAIQYQPTDGVDRMDFASCEWICDRTAYQEAN